MLYVTQTFITIFTLISNIYVLESLYYIIFVNDN